MLPSWLRKFSSVDACVHAQYTQPLSSNHAARRAMRRVAAAPPAAMGPLCPDLFVLWVDPTSWAFTCWATICTSEFRPCVSTDGYVSVSAHEDPRTTAHRASYGCFHGPIRAAARDFCLLRTYLALANAFDLELNRGLVCRP